MCYSRLLSYFRVPRYESTKPLLMSLHWLPMEHRIVFKLLVIAHNCLHGKAPEYLSDLLELYKPSRTLRSVDQFLLVKHKTRNSFGDRAFANSAPFLWNNLPFNIRSIETMSTFRKSLKTHLFKEYLIN